MDITFALLHSPLLGPATWSRLVPELTARGHGALLLRIEDDGCGPFWNQHARSASEGLAARRSDGPIVLVAHSGAGPLVPAAASLAPGAISACIFLDAGLPRRGSRFDSFAAEMGEKAARPFRALLDQGGRYPEWQDDDLVPIVPEPDDRASILREMRPRGAAFWDERCEFNVELAFPCAYLLTSAAYKRPAAEAKRRGWPAAEVDGGHFAMLSRPAAVAAALERLAQTLLS